MVELSRRPMVLERKATNTFKLRRAPKDIDEDWAPPHDRSAARQAFQPFPLKSAGFLLFRGRVCSTG